MLRSDATSAEVLVYTFKEGLLAGAAHDLKLRVTAFSIDEDGQRLNATFDPASLRVVNAMKDGREAPGVLSASMREDIERNVASAVLDARRYPIVRFESQALEPSSVRGQLTLHGVTHDVEGLRRDDATGRHAEFRFDQRRFGIKPFTAMLGALRIKAEVKVTITMPLR